MTDVSFFVNSTPKSLNPHHLAQILRQVSGVTTVHTSSATPKVMVSYQPHKTDTFALVTAVHDAGYSVITESITLPVAGMSCASCAFHIEGALTDTPGVIQAEVDLQTGIVLVTIAAESVPFGALCQAVQEAGYRVYEPVSNH